MADGGEAVVVFGTEDDLRLLLISLVGTLSISWDNDNDEDVMVADDDLVALADITGVTLAGESLEMFPTELLMLRTSITFIK